MRLFGTVLAIIGGCCFTFSFGFLSMKNNLLPSLAGVLVSLFVVWWLHGFLLVDRCLDSGGAINHKTNLCVGANEQIIELATSSTMLVIYCVVIMAVSLLTGRLLRKLLKS